MQKKHTDLIFISTTVIVLNVLFFLFEKTYTAYGEELEMVAETLQESHELISKKIFKENEQSSVTIHTFFDDASTNIAFYIRCPSIACQSDGTDEVPIYLFSAENIGRGSLPFSDYWVPPTPNEYVAVEYNNEAQQFSCSGLTLDACIADTHFIAQFAFSLIDSGSELPMNIKTSTSTATAALTQLSIALATSSITANLDEPVIVTGTFDVATGAPPVATTTETDTTTSFSEFISEIVESVIEVFTPEEVTEESAVEVTTPKASRVPDEPQIEDIAVEIIELQSPLSTDDETSNEIITSEF